MNSNKQDNDKTAGGAPETPRDFFSLSTPTLSDSAYSHHEFRLDVRNLTRGQLIESYVELKAQRDELLKAAKWAACCTGEYLYGDGSNPVCDYARKDIEHAHEQLKTAIARAEGGAQ